MSKKLLYNCLIAFVGSGISAFGLYHVHAQSQVTEGGILGLTLLLEYWLDISPALSSLVLNGFCYLVGIKVLGKEFLIYSAASLAGFSGIYRLCEQFDPLWPEIGEKPLLAALLGAVFIGVGVGMCVRIGGAPGGDDALAMSLSRLLHVKIQWVYLGSDMVVLGLSATYLPWQRLGYSLLTVVLSGQIIGWVGDLRFSYRYRTLCGPGCTLHRKNGFAGISRNDQIMQQIKLPDSGDGRIGRNDKHSGWK